METADASGRRTTFLISTVELAIGNRIECNGDDEPGNRSQEYRTAHTFPPVCVLVKMQKTRAIYLYGLDDPVIPIEPRKRSFQINLADKSK